MKYAFFWVLAGLMFLVVGCATKSYPVFAAEDARTHVVVQWDFSRDEMLDLASINGVSAGAFLDRRIVRDASGRLSKVCVLLEPGSYSLSLRSSNYKGAGKFLSGEVTIDYSLAAGVYKVCGKKDGVFAVLWLEDEKGDIVGHAGKTVLREVPQQQSFVPIPIFFR